MPPVNSAPSSDVDNEATAELPVLDIAAYEATLSDGLLEEQSSHTDTWAVPNGTVVQPTHLAEATTEMPGLKLDTIPTLTSAVPAYDLDHSGTHEMPAVLVRPSRAPRQANKPAEKIEATPAPPVATHIASASHAPPFVVVPPSPPLIEELRGALANAERRIEHLNERARIADAERTVAVGRANAECAQLREQLGAHLEALSTARERMAVQGTDQTELADAYFARGDRMAELEKQLAAQGQLLATTRAQLSDSVQRCEALDCDATNLRATVARRNSQIAMLEADLAARQQRETSLNTRLEAALAAIDPEAPKLHADIAASDEKLQELKNELNRIRNLANEKDADLQVAEENIRNLEIDLRHKTSKLEEASVTVEEWRAVIAESQRSILQRDGRIQKLEADLQKRLAAVVDSAARTGEEIALEGPARVLIRTDGNTDFVHVLGRRTRIGRGSDNELVLDTKHVSRYHAVLLAGPVHTSIEDLNSTNGVFVNNKRVSRQVLKDGDRVTVGKTQFRYTVRD